MAGIFSVAWVQRFLFGPCGRFRFFSRLWWAVRGLFRWCDRSLDHCHNFLGNCLLYLLLCLGSAVRSGSRGYFFGGLFFGVLLLLKEVLFLGILTEKVGWTSDVFQPGNSVGISAIDPVAMLALILLGVLVKVSGATCVWELLGRCLRVEEVHVVELLHLVLQT